MLNVDQLAKPKTFEYQIYTRRLGYCLLNINFSFPAHMLLWALFAGLIFMSILYSVYIGTAELHVNWELFSMSPSGMLIPQMLLCD